MGFVNLQKITSSVSMIAQRKKGRAHGESHWAAKLTDAEVETIRRLHEVDGWGYKKIARVMDCGVSTVQYICNFKRRGFL